jgi:hypothetical protein
MNKILLNILTILGLILVLLGMNLSHGIYGMCCFVLGGTISGLAMLKKYTKFLDRLPENTKLPEKIQYVIIPIVVILLTIFGMLGLITGSLVHVFLNPYEPISMTIVNTIFPIPTTMMATLPPGFIQLILQILLVGFGGVGILLPSVMICMPEFRNDVFVFGSDTKE